MEIIQQTPHVREDKTLLVLTHLSQLLHYVVGFGGLIVPLIIWAANKERVQELDENGKQILNFQISLIIYALLSIPAILLLGLGLITLLGVAILGFVLPIVNAVRVNRGEKPNYYISIKFLS
ncbi:DUF4870 domain-containing protein [Dokdonia sp. Asnod2-E02]|uniref:DUF4870 domain-containing protein n=1 Tax=Dokdonia sp. Asnod2-E02 TaxID=3160574 RepID=UPI00386C08F2